MGRNSPSIAAECYFIVACNNILIYCCGRMCKCFIAYFVCLFPFLLLVPFYICYLHTMIHSDLCLQKAPNCPSALVSHTLWIHSESTTLHVIIALPLFSCSPAIRSARLNKASGKETNHKDGDIREKESTARMSSKNRTNWKQTKTKKKCYNFTLIDAHTVYGLSCLCTFSNAD